MDAQNLNAATIVEIACGGRPDRPSFPREQGHAKPCFKLVNVLRYTRLCCILAVRGSGERAFLVGRDEQTNLLKAFAHCFNDASKLEARHQCAALPPASALGGRSQGRSYHPKSMANVPPARLIRPTCGAWKWPGSRSAFSDAQNSRSSRREAAAMRLSQQTRVLHSHKGTWIGECRMSPAKTPTAPCDLSSMRKWPGECPGAGRSVSWSTSS